MTNYTGGRNIGRQICVSSNALVYRLTGRSEDSQRRRITINGSVNDGPCDYQLYVRHLDRLPIDKALILEYPAITRVRLGKERTPVHVIGNGVQVYDVITEIVFNKHESMDGYREAADKILHKHGVEPDGKTPRTLAIVSTDMKSGLFKDVLFSSIHPKGDYPGADGLVPGKVYHSHKMLDGKHFDCLATYKGDGPGVEASKGQIEDMFFPQTAPPMSARQLAKWGFEDLQKNFFVVKEDGTKVDTAVSVGVVRATGDLVPNPFEIDKHNRFD